MKFSKSVRVRKRYEYLRFFHESEVKRMDSCIVFRVASSQPRLGITVKSNLGSVYRNRVRREVREVFRQYLDRLGPYDYNVVVSQPRGRQVLHRQEVAKKVRKNLESIWAQNEVRF